MIGNCQQVLLEKAVDQHSKKQTRRPGAGRKPRYGKAMVPLVARVPQDVKAAMEKQYGGTQKAVDALVIEVVRQWRIERELAPEETE